MSVKELLRKNLERYDTLKEHLETYRVSSEKVTALIKELDSEASRQVLAKDPYWPKWVTPWWKLTLLMEIEEFPGVPRRIVEHFGDIVNNHVLHFFPLVEAELPEGIRPHTEIACHCALGTVYRLLQLAGMNVRERYPWMHEWFSKYQLPDGGYNCEESVYTKPVPKSSIVSTVVPLEALLESRPVGDFTEEESDVLKKGARYLLDHRLFRSLEGKVIKENWKSLLFPRFYEYDILRGLKFVVDWAHTTKTSLDFSQVEESLEVIDSQVDAGGMLHVGRNLLDEKTVELVDGDYKFEQSGSFPLMEHLSVVGAPSPFLTRDWYQTIVKLNELTA